MVCGYCGNMIPDGAGYCPICGVLVSGQQPVQLTGYIVPMGYMNIGNPVKKPKGSAYTELPQGNGMLPFHSLFHAGNYYIENRVRLNTKDEILYRISSPAMGTL